MAVIEDLLEHIVTQLKKSGGSMPAAQAGALYKSNSEFDAAVTAAGSFKKFILKHGGTHLEFVDGMKGTEGVKGGCDIVRLKDHASGSPPRAHGALSLKRMDTDEQIEAAIALSLQDLDATSPSPFAPPPPPSSEPVRSAAAAASTKGPTSPPKDGNLKRNDSSQRTVCRFFKVSFLACH